MRLTRICRHSTQDVGNIVSPTYRPLLPPRNNLFLLEKVNDHIGSRTPDLPTYSLVLPTNEPLRIARKPCSKRDADRLLTSVHKVERRGLPDAAVGASDNGHLPVQPCLAGTPSAQKPHILSAKVKNTNSVPSVSS